MGISSESTDFRSIYATVLAKVLSTDPGRVSVTQRTVDSVLL